MDTPLPTVDAALAARIERAQAAQTASLLPPDGTLPVAGGFAFFAGVGSLLSQAVGLGLGDTEVRPEDLDRVEAHVGRGGGPVQVELSPFAHPSLAVLLGARGYRVAEFQQVLLRPLTDADAAAPPRADVRPLRPGEEEAFARTVAQGFLGLDSPDAVPPELATLLLPATRAPGTTCLVALVDGAPAGGGTLALHAGVATLSGTGVRPDARGRGLQAALVQARLALARAAGCTLAATSTAPATTSQRNMQRAGFRIAYPKVVLVRGG